jgi:uncharacterized protein
MEHVTFKNRGVDIAGNLHLPDDFDEGKSYSAIVLSTPGSSVKEQIGGIYASRLAKRGFVALTFDPSYQGASGGEPRDLENPFVRAEDIRCALDYLMTRSFVDEQRVGLLGICAGGGYAIDAALTERRFKAVGTVVASDTGTAFRRFQPSKEAMMKLLEDVGKDRTAQARSAEARRDPWIPDTLDAAEAAGITDAELLEAIYFYRESEYRHPNSTNRLLFESYAYILKFDPYHMVPQFLTQPLQVVVGGRRGETKQFEEGARLFALSPAEHKDFFIVEGASHYDMYYKPEYVSQAIDKLVPFFEKHLNA